MAFDCQTNSMLDQCLSDSIEINEKTSGICIDIERLVKVSTVVYFSDDSRNDCGNSVNFSLLTHEVDLVMQSLSNLENGVDQEAIIQFLRLSAERVKQLLAKLLLHVVWEIVQKTQKVFKAYNFCEITGCHHDLDQKELQLFEKCIISTHRECEVLEAFEYLLDENLYTALIQ